MDALNRHSKPLSYTYVKINSNNDAEIFNLVSSENLCIQNFKIFFFVFKLTGILTGKQMNRFMNEQIF